MRDDPGEHPRVLRRQVLECCHSRLKIVHVSSRSPWFVEQVHPSSARTGDDVTGHSGTFAPGHDMNPIRPKEEPMRNPAALASERVVIQSPLSFVGSTRRIWRLTEQRNAAVRWALAVPAAVVLLLVAWLFVAAWTLAFGIFVVPYRVLRRGARKRKRDALRHRELLDG